MAVPSDRRYLKSHEWHKPEGDLVVVGITDHAAEELTDITFVNLPAIGRKVKAGDSFGEVESVKATSDLFCGVNGEIVAVNEDLRNDPGLINRDPFGAGWIIKIKPVEMTQLDELLSSDAYQAGV
jgi:glycine cleavage system H protein